MIESSLLRQIADEQDRLGHMRTFVRGIGSCDDLTVHTQHGVATVGHKDVMKGVAALIRDDYIALCDKALRRQEEIVAALYRRLNPP